MYVSGPSIPCKERWSSITAALRQGVVADRRNGVRGFYLNKVGVDIICVLIAGF